MTAYVQSMRFFIAPVLFFALLSASALIYQSALAQESETAPPAPTDQTTSTEGTSQYIKETVPGGDSVIGDFVVGPGKVELAIEPGARSVTEITVTNRTGETREFGIQIEDAVGSQDPDRTIVLLGDDRGPYSLRDYVSVPNETFELEHNQRARIPVTISIPEDAEPGGLYGSVLVRTISQKAVPGDGVSTVPQSAIIARVGTLFFVTVPGDIERSGALRSFSTIPEKQWFQNGPIHFEILFENAGSIHLSPYGELRITNILGDEVGYVEIEPWFALPDSLRLREIVWDREFLFGKYTATVEINRGYDNVVDRMEYSFWVLPWKPVALTIVAIFIVIFLVHRFFKRFEFRRKEL